MQRRNQFKADLQREIDAIIDRKAISPLRLALAVENLTKLAQELFIIERANAIMCQEMPNCRTMLDRRDYFGHTSAFLVKARKLQSRLTILKDNIGRKYRDRRWISSQMRVMEQYADL